MLWPAFASAADPIVYYNGKRVRGGVHNRSGHLYGLDVHVYGKQWLNGSYLPRAKRQPLALGRDHAGDLLAVHELSERCRTWIGRLTLLIGTG